MANRLARESSPYLRQHADNPVDWHPWGDEAFARARREEKPIFLSIGYSTCHWCHVMEHESFESAAIAEVLNEHFVSIKVDREERPDVDRVYMLFVQATTGAGGWPMSVWLTPQLEPFYGGTYFPPDSRWGRPGFIDVLQQIARVWRDERANVERSARDVVTQLQQVAAQRTGAGAATGERAPEPFEAGLGAYERSFDHRHGGFGDAPKFPRPSELLYLLRVHAATGHPGALDMVEATLKAMALGGMRDHIGGGFHRYSVDAAWRVPHFEKMLYDQAQLVLAYLELAQATGDEFYAAVAEDTIDYVLRDLTHPDGGFFSAEDADSVPPELAGAEGAHKSEGAFYIWSVDEVRQLLADADAEIVVQRFGFEPSGNAPQDPHGEFRGKNIPYVSQPLEAVAARTGSSVEQIVEAIGRAREALFARRATRPRPGLDDKVLASWNGLMIAALARAARYAAGRRDAGAPAAERRFRDAAVKAARFLRRVSWHHETQTLRRRYRDGESAIDGFCEDYACLAFGLLELYQLDGDLEWLDWAIALQHRADELFGDDEGGGWFSTTGADASVLLRLKDDYDGAEPSAGSVAALNAVTLAHLTGEPSWADRAHRAFSRHDAPMAQLARVMPWLCCAIAAEAHGLQQVVIVGPRGDAATARIRAQLGRLHLPFAVVLWSDPAERHAIAARLPFVAGMPMQDGRVTLHVCANFACRAPEVDPPRIDAALDALAQPASAPRA